jgi:hypothetical protein
MSANAPRTANSTRQRRRRLAALAVGALLAAAGCSSGDEVVVSNSESTAPTGDTSIETEPDDTAPTSTLESTSTIPEQPDPSTTTTTAPPSTTAVSDDGPLTIAEAQAVADTDREVLIDDGSNSWSTVVFDDSSARGLALLIDDTIVYQPAQSNDIGTPATGFAIIDDDGAELYGEDDRAVTVFDVGHVDGVAMILAGSVPTRAMPDDGPGELVLIDIASREQIAISDIGAYEAGVRQARFGEDAISVQSFVSAQNFLEILELDGTPRHEIELPSDTNLSLVDFDEEIWVLQPDFVGDAFDPVLRTHQYDLATAESRKAELKLVEDGVGIDTAFCDVADFFDDRIVCNRSQGSPILIKVAVDAATTSPMPNVDFGTIRFRASQ